MYTADQSLGIQTFVKSIWKKVVIFYKSPRFIMHIDVANLYVSPHFKSLSVYQNNSQL